MITLDFDDIFSSFHNKVDAYDFLDLEDYELEELESEWLKSAGSKPYIRRLFSSYEYNDDDEVINFEMSYSVDDDFDTDFVIEILALGVAIEYLTPKVNSLNLINQMFGNKEGYSQQQHLKEVRALRDSWIREQRKIIRDRGTFFNSYIEGYGD